MKKISRNKNIILIILILFGISIGYAFLNKTLEIKGNSEVKKTTWDIHFENVIVKEGSVEPIKKPTIDNTRHSVDFSFELNLPGDFFEFTVDIANVGTMSAMIDSIVKTPELTAEQKKYLKYTIEYPSSVQIAPKDVIMFNSFMRIKVRVEYRTDISENDLPTSYESLNLGFVINFVQAEYNEDSEPEPIKAIAHGDINEIGTVVTIGEEQFYTVGVHGDLVNLLAMYNLEVGNKLDSAFNVLPINYPTGKQSMFATGFNFDDFSKTVGVTAFSNNRIHGTTNSEYVGSIVYNYIYDYEEYLAENYKGLNIYEVRLISVNELTSSKIGCSTTELSCSDAPSFIYSTSYWTCTSYGNDYIWAVYSIAGFDMAYYSIETDLGVRPLVSLYKDSFE